MSKKTYDLTDKAIRRYALHLREQERAPATVRQPRPSYRQLHAGRRQWFLSLHGLEGHRRKAVENTKGPLLR